jgi:hypothetical protein
MLAGNSDNARTHAIAKSGYLGRAGEPRANDSNANRFSVRQGFAFWFVLGIALAIVTNYPRVLKTRDQQHRPESRRGGQFAAGEPDRYAILKIVQALGGLR